ncbi:isochorismatase family protein [Caldimonas sp. KR1-144]|uniref:isochorismatase family protein n=1 Tax=Caldimonas sp. KR1-144 TaxID=3400911 RepID=UPI003C2AD9B3
MSPGSGDALLVVDLQRDFLRGGALAVPGAERVVAQANRWVERFAAAGLPVFASRDWHPAHHCSFAQQGGPWPAHCVAGSHGAEFAPGLRLPPHATIVSKGTAPRQEAYSAFGGTSLAQQLNGLGVGRLFVVGVATEYCVAQTVLDACALGLSVVVPTDAVAAIDAAPGGAGERVLREMAAAGARCVAGAAIGARRPAHRLVH